MGTQFSELSKSSKSGVYGTPIDFYNKLNSIFHFEIDPCASTGNDLNLPYWYTEEDEGLLRSWDKNTFINPPFGRGIDRWIEKMKSQSQIHENCIYCMLLPARTDTKYFQDSILSDENTIIHFIKGRLKFRSNELNKNNQPHIIGSMLWLLENNDGISKDKISELNRLIPGFTIRKRDNNNV